MFLADAYFTERGIRDRVELVYVTPLDGAFTKPTASATLSSLLDEKGIELVTEFNTGEIDNEAKKLVRRPPSLTEVERWVADAATLAPAVTY